MALLSPTWPACVLVRSTFKGLNPNAPPSPVKPHVIWPRLSPPPHLVSSSHPVPRITYFILTPGLVYLKSLLEMGHPPLKGFLDQSFFKKHTDHSFTSHHIQSLIPQSALSSSEYLTVTKIKLCVPFLYPTSPLKHKLYAENFLLSFITLSPVSTPVPGTVFVE